MSGGLFALLDDVAAIAKLAVASIDDLGAAAGKTSLKAAGVVVDDTAVTPMYVQGVRPNRELPVIFRIARGSLRNKMFLILPVALLLSAFAPLLVELLLMVGGCYLAFEAAHKLREWVSPERHAEPATVAPVGEAHEEMVVRDAIRTDLILSAEIMVIALNELLDASLAHRALTLAIVAVVITTAVYGVVALIVKLDDIGLSLARRATRLTMRIGRFLVRVVPKLLALLGVVGTLAMCWVGGHILIEGADSLGWHTPHDLLHHLSVLVHGVALEPLLSWMLDTAASSLVGAVVGVTLLAIATAFTSLRSD